MDELEQEFKRNFSNIPGEGTFSGDRLWESQAWLLRTRMKVGDDIQEFWDNTQGQMTTYARKLNSEDQKKATAEAVQTFNLALRTGFTSCNAQMDGLLQQVFVEGDKDEEESFDVEQDSIRDAPPLSPVKNSDLDLIPTGPTNVISLVDEVDDYSTQYRIGPDPPETATELMGLVRKEDPAPSQQVIRNQESPDVIDVTNAPNAILNNEQGDRTGEFDNVSSGSGNLSLTQILLQSYLPTTEDTPERKIWSSGLVPSDETTIPALTYLAKPLLHTLGVVSNPIETFADSRSPPPAESREETGVSFGRLSVDTIDLAGHGSQTEPIDLTMYEHSTTC